ncbi:MAG: relaxase/mobilization nuclease domain-containing protein [Pleurocapsa minor HA4230-MV1]|jgi:hypothetical protein|nr:relaxase/mobilization nuclease domain-containing protein [Pleurocapsa minor HA4230-MV1]
MIAKQIKGKNFRGVLEYLQEKEGSYILGGNMAGNTPSVMSAEFAIAKQLNPNLKKVVFHSSLSLPKSEHLKDDTWRAIAAEYLKKMGFTGCQYVVYRHTDKDHDHIHLVASRIRITDGTTVTDSWDYLRSEKIVRELEQKYQLIPTISFKAKLKRGQTTGEIKLIERTGEQSIRLKLQQTIDALTKEPVTMPELVNRLKSKGINAQVSFTQTEEIRGLSFELGGVAISGAHLGQAYTFHGMQKYLQVSFDMLRDREALLVASKRKPAQKTKLEMAHLQQEERSLIIAPILKDLINKTRNSNPVTDNYRISWEQNLRTLSLFRKDNTLILTVKYQDGKFEPQKIPLIEENKPLLKEADLKYWQQVTAKLKQNHQAFQSPRHRQTLL